MPTLGMSNAYSIGNEQSSLEREILHAVSLLRARICVGQRVQTKHAVQMQYKQFFSTGIKTEILNTEFRNIWLETDSTDKQNTANNGENG